MKVLFRSDSSTQIGFGHIKRDLVLAKQYKDVSFACIALEGCLINKIPHKVYKLKSSDIDELIGLIRQEKFELLIIDHYDINAHDERRIKAQTGITILSLDDEIKTHYCDILLNGNPYAKSSDYAGLVPPKCELRCGFSHVLIGDEFYRESAIKRDKIYDYFICMGATDVKNLSLEIAYDLPKQKRIAIATSSSNKNLGALQKHIQYHQNIQLFIDKDIAKLMNESAKLIISASSLVNECLILRANFRSICYVKNQEKMAKWLEKKGYEVEYRL